MCKTRFARDFLANQTGEFLKKNLPENQIAILCDESGSGQKASEILSSLPRNKLRIAILISSEGGFSKT